MRTEAGCRFTIALCLAGALAASSSSVRAEYPQIAFTPSVVAEATNMPLWSTWRDGTRPWGGYNHYVYLALVARLHPDAQTRANAAARAVAQAQYFLANHAFDQGGWVFEGGHHDHEQVPIVAFLAMCRRIPAIWENMSADLRARMDGYMRIAGYCVSMFANYAHNGGWNKLFTTRGEAFSSNVNQNTAYHMAPMVLIYWGGYGAFNAMLASYDSTAMTHALTAYGWAPYPGKFAIWTKPEFLASLDTGVPLTPTYAGGPTNTFSARGIREPFASFRGLRITDPVEPMGQWFAPVLSYPTAAEMFARVSADWNYGKRCIDRNAGNGKGRHGHGYLQHGTNSPYLGEDVMPSEYHVGSRSSQHYVTTTALNMTMPNLCALMALGHWKNPDPVMDAVLAKVRKGLAIWRYRDLGPNNGGRWHNSDHGHCESNSTYRGGKWWHDMFDKIIFADLRWPGEHIGAVAPER
ncbi:MAG: hypothetical protein JXR37_14150 [Kiritimatiellae bacterium]|nr:hypothetical protein [Kiritimatiellia bacterium]